MSIEIILFFIRVLSPEIVPDYEIILTFKLLLKIEFETRAEKVVLNLVQLLPLTLATGCHRFLDHDQGLAIEARAEIGKVFT